jgi:aspartate/tyrosine/aromatic aminotransferase
MNDVLQNAVEANSESIMNQMSQKRSYPVMSEYESESRNNETTKRKEAIDNDHTTETSTTTTALGALRIANDIQSSVHPKTCVYLYGFQKRWIVAIYRAVGTKMRHLRNDRFGNGFTA